MPFRPVDILTIAELTHWIVVCSMKDVVIKDGSMSLAREGILSCWSRFEERRASLQGPSGLSVPQERKDLRTHLITIRFRYDIDFRSSAWIFEKRMKSSPRWWKVLAVQERTDRVDFDARLYDRSDDTALPVKQGTANSLAVSMPDSVKL